MDIYNTINYMKQNHKTIFDLNIRVTYYVRVSTLKEEQDSSVENQIAYFEKMIAEHSNWAYVEGYVDRIRGESAANRENFMKMIQDGKDGKFDLILTKEVSRFARNTIDSLTYTRELLRCGVGVFFQNDNICTVDSDAEFRLTIMSSIAQDEVRKLSERVKFGHSQSIKKGVVMGNSRIYGYDKKDGKLVINEKEAEMVRYIFEQYSTGVHALRAIERQLYDLGYRSHNGTKIHHNTINSIIRNPKYKGYYCGNKVKISDYRTKEQVFLPEEEWIMYKDESGETVPAIVSEEIWNKANEIFKKRSDEVKKHGRGKKTTSVLSGKIVCTHHNSSFWRTSYSHILHRDENIYQWLCCEKKKNVSKSCPTFAIYETELYEILEKCFTLNMKNFNIYAETFVELYKKMLAESDSLSQINELIKEKEKLENKKDVLLDLYMSGDITKDEFKKRNGNLNLQITENETEYQALKSKQISEKDIEKRLAEIHSAIVEILNRSNSEHLSREEIDLLVGMFVDKIEVTSIDKKNMKINIIMNIGNSHEGVFNRSSGIMFKKMLPELQLNTTRIFGRELVLFTYYVTLTIVV